MSDNNEEKNVDGIKKLSREEIEQSRKLVLDLIGEKAQDKPSTEKAGPTTGNISFFKKIDGVIKNNFSGEKNKKVELNNEQKAEIKKNLIQEIKAVIPDKKNDDEKKPSQIENRKIIEPEIEKIAEKTKLDDAKKIEENLKKQEEEKLAKLNQAEADKRKTLEEKVRIQKLNEQKEHLKLKQEEEKEKVKAERIEIERKKLLEEQAQQKKVKANKELAKAQKEEIEKRRRFEDAAIRDKKRAAKDKEAADKLEYKRLRVAKIKYKLSNLRKTIINYLFRQLPAHLVNVAKFSFNILLTAIIIGLFIYSIFGFLIIKTHIDNKASRYIAKYLPVPALISKYGIIEYYRYNDLKTSFYGCCSSADEMDKQIKFAITSSLMVNNLMNRYNLKSAQSKDMEKIVMLDSDVNQVAISRIRKIKSLIDNGGDMAITGNKYADKYGQFVIYNNEIAPDEFTNITNIELGHIGNVIYTPSGFYIFRLSERDNEKKSYNYIFVKAKTLAEYINENIGNYKFISLVD